MADKEGLDTPKPPLRRRRFIFAAIIGIIALILIIVIPIVVSQQGHRNATYVNKDQAKKLALKVMTEVPLVDG